MQVYRWVWGALATLVLGAASASAVSAGLAVEMVVLGAGSALFATMFVWVVAEDHPARWLWVRRSVLWAGVGAPGADAVGTAWGTTGVVLAAVLLLTSPTLLGLARDQYGTRTSRGTAGPPESLSERDLRRRWDSTTGEVRHRATAPARRLVLVEERRRLLDELERRDPVHFDAWVVTAVPQDRPTRARRRSR